MPFRTASTEDFRQKSLTMPLNAFSRLCVEPVDSLSQKWAQLSEAFPEGEVILLTQGQAEIYLAIVVGFLANLIHGRTTCRFVVEMQRQLMRLANQPVEGADIGGVIPDGDYPDSEFQDAGNALLNESHRSWRYLCLLEDAIQEVAGKPLRQQTAANVRAAFLRGVDMSNALSDQQQLDLMQDLGLGPATP